MDPAFKAFLDTVGAYDPSGALYSDFFYPTWTGGQYDKASYNTITVVNATPEPSALAALRRRR